MTFREKRILSGPILELELYPITLIEKNKSRAKKSKESKKEQQNLNYKNSLKHLIRLVNTNFKKGDLFIHLTYDGKHRPKSVEQAMKDIQNYIRRIKNWLKKNKPGELKYIAVIETGDKKQIHHHIIMSGVDREVAENLWGKGRCNIDRLQPDEFGFEAAARYIAKDAPKTKRRMQSKNLKMPEVKINDSKFTRRKAEKLIAMGDSEIERLYPGYSVSSIDIQVNEVIGTTSFYIKMRRIE